MYLHVGICRWCDHHSHRKEHNSILGVHISNLASDLDGLIRRSFFNAYFLCIPYARAKYSQMNLMTQYNTYEINWDCIQFEC